MRDTILETAARLHAAGLPARFEIRLGAPGPKLGGLKAAVSLARALCAIDARFETPLRRLADIPARTAPAEETLALEAWAARTERPWPDPSRRRSRRAAFYLAEAQRAPRRRLAQHLLRTLALVRVRLGFFGLDLERRLVEFAALLRTGRTRPASRRLISQE